MSLPIYTVHTPSGVYVSWYAKLETAIASAIAHGHGAYVQSVTIARTMTVYVAD